jgi:hypothetical protein
MAEEASGSPVSTGPTQPSPCVPVAQVDLWAPELCPLVTRNASWAGVIVPCQGGEISVTPSPIRM